MTAEELRALDVEIHRKVFGFKDLRRLPVGISPDCGNREIFDSVGMFDAELDWCYLPKYDHDEKGDDFCRVVPAYSSDIAAAWEVVEKLCAMPGCRGVEVENAATQCGSWGCAVWWKDEVTFVLVPAYQTLSPTAPLAICRAALKAVAKEQP